MFRYLLVVGGMILLAIGTAFVSFDRALSKLPDDPQNRGTLTYADTSGPTNLDPNKTSASVDFRLLKCMYQTLLVYQFGGEGLEPGVATAIPEPTNGGRTYTFNLREEARWSDGEPVIAQDFVYAWRRALLPDTASDYAGLLYKIEGGEDFHNWRAALVNFEALEEKIKDDDQRAAFLERFPELEAQAAVDADGRALLTPEQKWALTEAMFDELVGIKALDDHTLQVTLEVPTAFFLELCAFPTFSPIPEHVVEQYTQFVGGDKNDATVRTDSTYWGDPDRVVMNGAYTLSFYKLKSRLVLDQNPHYWAKDTMGNLRIVLEIVEDETLAILLFKDGQVDWIVGISQPELKKKLLSSGYEHAHSVPNAGTYYYQYNCRAEMDGKPNPLADRRVRQALSMCINRQEIVDNVMGSGESVSLTFVPADQIPGYDSPNDAALGYDPVRAAELLAEAGYPGGEGIPKIDLLVNATGTGGGANVDIAVVIKKVWEDELGIRSVNISQPIFQVYLEESKKGNFMARRAGWFGDYRDPTTWLDMLQSSDPNNDAKYSSPAYDALLAAAALEVDAQKRLDLLRDAEALLLQEAPVSPIYTYATLMIYDAQQIDLGTNAWNNLRLDLVRIERD
ncbi:peptide ABC transporter substrate-binding protein [Phycisphaeraceae bacterium D3-23]